MTIGVDIRVLAKGARTGVEEYTINLLSHLLSCDPEINYRLFYNAFKKASLNYNWLSLGNVELGDFKIPNRLFFTLARYGNWPKVDKLLGDIDVYFNPHFFTTPLSNSCRRVVTFHDLAFTRYPEFFSKRKRLWQWFFMNAKKEAERADKIISDSLSTKDDLINLYNIDPKKIEVVYLGVGEQFRPIKNKKETLKSIRGKYNLPDKFILYFGTIEPRKNIVGLIRAFELFRERNKKTEHKLVIAGAKGWLCGYIFKEAKNSKYSRDIFFTGFVDESDKPSLYNLADLFVFPSFFEGFGFPPLEAMACGVPTIVSNRSSLPEVVGSSSLMVDPNDIDQLSWVMKEIFSNNSLKDKYIKRGILRAKNFSWPKCARKTLNILKSL